VGIPHYKHNPTCTGAMGQDYPLTPVSEGSGLSAHSPVSETILSLELDERVVRINLKGIVHHVS
jgi:hypothetical protein